MRLIESVLKNPVLRAIFAALAILQVAVQANAADAPRYAVLSLVGDRIQLQQRVPATETQAERSVVEFIEIPDKVFDQTVVIAVNEVLRRADPTSAPVLLEARDTSLYLAQAQLLEEGSAGAAKLRALLTGTRATHLILVTRLRSEAMLEAQGGHFSGGSLEGLGFYIDRSKSLIASDSGQAAFGFLSPFAYFQISIYDIARHQVLRQERVTATKTLSAARSPEGDPWTTLTGQQKVTVLQDMLTKEIARVMPRVVRSIF